MSKKKAKKVSSAEALSPDAAARALNRLINDKEREVGDGSLQVILAIASVTSLVTVDTSTTPPTFEPPDLGKLTFNDVKVGLSNT
jgi:hypothetical protein